MVRSPITRIPRLWHDFTSRARVVVAAKQRVDVFERVGVVAVARRGGKERCQVQTAHREQLQVVEAGLDPLQVAAVHLTNGAPPVSVDGVVPR